MKSKNQDQMLLVGKWNSLYRPGQKVILEMDDGSKIETKTRSEAELLSGHSAVCWFEGVRGCYLLERATPL